MYSVRYSVSLLALLLVGGGASGGLEAFSRTTSDTATVRTVQRALRDRGLYSGAIDGVLNERTSQALAGFQESAELTPSGQIDDPTLVALGILQPESQPLRSTTESTLQGVEDAGQTALNGIESTGKGTMKGVSVVGGTTARGVAAAGNTTANAAEATGKTLVNGGEAGVETVKEAGAATMRGAEKLGRGAANGVAQTGTKVTDFLGVSRSDGKIRKDVTERLERDPYLARYRIHVSVEDGKVTLVMAGDNVSEEDLDRAAAIAGRVKGVSEVVVPQP